MSGAPELVAENEVAFFFETNERIPARLVIEFMAEVERIARNKSVLGPEAVLEFVELERGTLLIKVAAWATIVGTGLVAIQLGMTVADKLSEKNERISRCVATMALDHGVVSTTLVTCEGGVTVGRDTMQAVQIMREERDRQLELEQARTTDTTVRYLGDHKGRRLTNESGQPIAIEASGFHKGDGIEKTSKEREPQPVRGKWLYETSSDVRGAEAFIGRFNLRGDGLLYFDAETGMRMGAILDEDMQMRPEDVPLGDRVSVLATVDMDNRTIFIFEFYPVAML